MRSILIFADRGNAMATRLETGLSLARNSNGHVTLLVDTPITRFISMDPMGGSYIASDAMRQALEDDDVFASKLDEHLQKEDVPFDVIRAEDEPVVSLTNASRLADVVVVSRSAGFAGQLALTLRTPVLVAPEDRPLLSPVESACVLWDGGDEAAVALRSAMSMLSVAAKVHVLTVAEKSGGFPPTDALRYLSRHGVNAELHEIPRKGSIEDALAGEIAVLNADLVVMGAFGHSRMRQYLFGGVTRTFLDDLNGPALLLAH